MADDPVVLRQRAASLQNVARRFDQIDLRGVLTALGEDTWIGASPQRCRDEIRAAERRLHDAAATTRAHAQRLLARAAHAEQGPPGIR